MVNAIFAYSPQNNVFGNKGELPWPRSKVDMHFFKDTTSFAVLIMGRGTWESLPGKLPNRTHVVISKSGKVKPNGLVNPDNVFGSLKEALDFYSNMTCYVIGGPSLLEEAVDICDLDSIYMTQFLTDNPYQGDVFLSDTFLRKVAEKYQIKRFIDDSKSETHPTKEVRIMQLTKRTTFGG